MMVWADPSIWPMTASAGQRFGIQVSPSPSSQPQASGVVRQTHANLTGRRLTNTAKIFGLFPERTYRAFVRAVSFVGEGKNLYL